MNQNTAPDTVNNAPTVGDYSPQAHASVQDRAGLYIAIVALIIAAISLGISLMQPAVTNATVENLQDRVQTAERESRVMQERWNDLKVELAKRGIPVTDH